MNKRTQQNDGSCSNGQNRNYLGLMTHQLQDKINRHQSQFSRAVGTHLSPYRLLQQRVANWGTYKNQRPISHMPGIPRPRCQVNWCLGYSLLLSLVPCCYVFMYHQGQTSTHRRFPQAASFTHGPHTKSYLLISAHWGFDFSMWVWEGRNIQAVVTLETEIKNKNYCRFSQ